jgi:hypothetical protein
MKGVKKKTYQLKYAWYATNLSLCKKWEKVWDEVKYCSDKEVTNNMANKTLRLILGIN